MSMCDSLNTFDNQVKYILTPRLNWSYYGPAACGLFFVFCRIRVFPYDLGQICFDNQVKGD